MAEQKQPRLSKRMKTVRGKVDRAKAYNVDDALKLVKETATAKFNESIDIAVMLGVRRSTIGYVSQFLRAVPRVPTIGWTTKANFDKRYGNLGVFDRDRWRLLNNAFHLGINFAPADRPHIANVIAVWQIENGETRLIYWAETTETLRGREPDAVRPRPRLRT